MVSIQLYWQTELGQVKYLSCLVIYHSLLVCTYNAFDTWQAVHSRMHSYLRDLLFIQTVSVCGWACKCSSYMKRDKTGHVGWGSYWVPVRESWVCILDCLVFQCQVYSIITVATCNYVEVSQHPLSFIYKHKMFLWLW